MAVDEALLRTASHHDRITLRVYRWEQPTLSLGYFQKHDWRQQHTASQNCSAVRRATGGGAILHDREITYSLTAPVADRLDQQILGWYDLVHHAWVATLARYGIRADLCAASQRDREGEFLCFQRRSTGDLLLDGWKIGGSAQRRHRDTVLQHGSLLLQQSPAAPELPGIAQLSGRDLTATSWLETWILEIGQRLGVAWEQRGIDTSERDLAAKLAIERFGNPKWTLRR